MDTICKEYNSRMIVPRPRALARIARSFGVHPAVALLGPRQCGKTTLAREFVAGQSEWTFFDLESAVGRRKLASPEEELGRRTGLVVIDEVQREPAVFEALRVLVDRPDSETRFLLLGSASPDLVRGASETLAGRLGFVNLSGFDLSEVGGNPAEGDPRAWRPLWERGGFPRSYLATDEELSAVWRDDFVTSFLERDVPQLGITVPAETLRRFWTMVAHYHGQTWNAAEFARSLGSNRPTARRYLDILSGAYMVRVLPPWIENLKKRQIKAPKIYLRDSGLLQTLLEVPSAEALTGHVKVGASFEGFAIEQVLSCLRTRNAYFWGTQGGAELDLLITRGGKRYGFEVKYADAPGTTRSMHTAIADLGLEHLWVIYPGSERYRLREKITALPIRHVPDLFRDGGADGR